MKKIAVSVSLFLLIFILFNQCKHEDIKTSTNIVVDTTKVNPIDTTKTGIHNTGDSVCFNTQIFPLIMSNCGMSGCHDANTHAKGLNVTSYSYIAYYASQIYSSVSKNNMPKGLPNFTTAQKAMFQKWINEGKRNVNCYNPCDTNNVTYTNSIQPLVQNYCVGCHSTASAVKSGGGVIIDNYTNTKTQTQTGHLICAIDYTGTCSQMPKGLNKLSFCEIRKFKIWMNNNFPQ